MGQPDSDGRHGQSEHINLVVRPVVGSCRVPGGSQGDFDQIGKPGGSRKQSGRKRK